MRLAVLWDVVSLDAPRDVLSKVLPCHLHCGPQGAALGLHWSSIYIFCEFSLSSTEDFGVRFRIGFLIHGLTLKSFMKVLRKVLGRFFVFEKFSPTQSFFHVGWSFKWVILSKAMFYVQHTYQVTK